MGEEGGNRFSAPYIEKLKSLKSMNVVLIGLLLLFVIAFFYNVYNCEEFTLSIDLNLFNSQYFKIGLVNERFVTEEYSVDVLVIGLLFINVEFSFYKELEG